MPNYILRTHPAYTLVLYGKSYQNGDPITISAEDAHRIAYSSKVHRFEKVGDDDAGEMVGMDRHRSGRHLRGQSVSPPAGSDQDTAETPSA